MRSDLLLDLTTGVISLDKLKGHTHDYAHDHQQGVRPRKLEKNFQVLCNAKSNKIVYYLPLYST